MRTPGRIVRALIAALVLHQSTGRADWLRDETSIAWRDGTNVVWRFSFDPKKGKPFFHPLTVTGSPSLTDFKPEDHPWHYGLWFSWKYINPAGSTNHVNYWEEDRVTGQAQGKTSWAAPAIVTTADGSAHIQLDLRYNTPDGYLDITEHRDLKVSAPRADGAYDVNWRAHFTVGQRAIVLDRTPMLGEPGGQTNGGYAGLAFRMAGPPLQVSMISSTGPVTRFVADRARPNAPATAFNFLDGEKLVGSLAIFTDTPRENENPPWYLVNGATFRFACAALLAPKPIRHQAGDQFDLNYTVSIRPKAWTIAELRSGIPK